MQGFENACPAYDSVYHIQIEDWFRLYEFAYVQIDLDSAQCQLLLS